MSSSSSSSSRLLLLQASLLALCLLFRCGAAFSRHPRAQRLKMAAVRGALEGGERVDRAASLPDVWLGDLPLKRHRNWLDRAGGSAFERYFNLGQEGPHAPVETSSGSSDNILRYG